MIETWLIAWWVLFLALAWWPCCCVQDGPECVNCFDGQTTEYMTLVVSGVADGTCSDCELADGTYIVQQDGWYTTCFWGRHYDPIVCLPPAGDNNETRVYLQALSDGTWETQYVIMAGAMDTGCTYYFTAANPEDQVDCMNADGTGVHYLTYEKEVQGSANTGACDRCDFTNATIEVYSGDTS